jgi:hypothetical protein
MSDSELAKRRGQVDAQLDDVDDTLGDHERRITDLEKFKYMVVGALFLISAVLGFVSLQTAVGMI